MYMDEAAERSHVADLLRHHLSSGGATCLPPLV